MSRYSDIDPMDLDPETGRPYAGYSSDCLDTSFHEAEMNVGDAVSDSTIVDIIARMSMVDPEYDAEDAADTLNSLIEMAKKHRREGGAA